MAALAAVLTPSHAAAADWPHWRGPNRDGTTSETSGVGAGVWPLKSPIWTADTGATGETSPIVAGGRVYTMGHRDGRDTVFCVDLASGRVLWRQSYAARPRGRFATGDLEAYVDGPIATPEYDAETGYLYTLGVDGELACWDTKREGARVWGLNLYDRFGAQRRPLTGVAIRDYGYTTAPLAHGRWLIVEAGAEAGNLVAFDKRSGGSPVGTPEWSSACKEPAGHSGGLAPLEVGGTPCVAVLTVRGLAVTRLDRGHEGETLAWYPFQAIDAANIVTPAVSGDLVVLSTHHGPADVLVRVTRAGAARVGPAPHTEVGAPIFHDRRLYRTSGILEAWDLSTDGQRRLWQADDLGGGGTAILTGDGKLIAKGYTKLSLYNVDGKLLAASPGFRTGWQQLAVADGKLVHRDASGVLRCYSLRRAATAAR